MHPVWYLIVVITSGAPGTNEYYTQREEREVARYESQVECVQDSLQLKMRHKEIVEVRCVPRGN